MANSLRNSPRRSRGTSAAKPSTPVSAKTLVIAGLIGVGLILLVMLSVWLVNREGGSSLSSTQKKIEKVAEIVSHEPVPNSSMHAWFVKLKSDGSPALFYTTKDGSTMATGTLWDVESGDPLTTALTDKLLGDNPELGGAVGDEQAVAGEADLTPGQALGEYKGEVPELFAALDVLGGFKEDPSVAPENTIYAIYDPRCPYCHKLFDVTRNVDLKAKGLTIKWLPTVALGANGADDPAVGQAAYAMEAKNVEDFAKSLTTQGVTPNKVDKPTEDHLEALDANLALLYDATDRAAPGQAKAVPAVFYLDKRNGKPKMVFGAQEPEVLRSIFGD